ncbi:MAG: hypothetical protein AAB668_03690 [Patescibacteria group bacterium]
MKTIHGFLFCSMAAAAFAVSGCTAFGPMPIDAICDGLDDDGVACTVTVCPAAGGAYQHIPNDALCASGQMCSATAGCVPRDSACPASCDDEIACTVDSCVSGACRRTANDSLCSSGTCRASAADGASGCYTPPTMEGCSSNADCNDAVSCTVNRCVSGECRYVPDDAACPTGQTCSATAGCVDEAPTGDFTCVYTADAHRIGYSIRVRAADMSGVRTIPSSTGETRAMSGSRIRLWALGTGAEIDSSPSSGWAVYSLAGTPGGAINAHPYLGQWRFGDPAYDRDILNVANLQVLSGRTCRSLGIQLQSCLNPSGCGEAEWVDAPDAFCTIRVDTRGAEFWNDPVIALDLRGDDVVRAVIDTSGSDDSATCTPVSS